MEMQHSYIFIDYEENGYEYTVCVIWLNHQRPPMEMIIEHPPLW